MPRIHSCPQEYKNYVKQIQDNIKFTTIKYLNNFRENVFKKFPRLHSIWWEQYSPRFNDGDRCYFRAMFKTPSIELEDSSFVLTGEEFINEETGEYVNTEEELPESCQYIDEVLKYSLPFLKVLRSDVLDSIYGESKVVIYKDSIKEEDVYIDE